MNTICISDMVPDADRLAKICFTTFERLKKTGKPNENEWTVLACIVKYEHQTDQIEVVSMGTGTRSIGRSFIDKEGLTLNDSHAEVVCRRGFLLYLYNEIFKTIDNDNSIFSFNDIKKKFEVSSNISFHFVTSFQPCGDASIFCIEPKLQNFTGAKLIQKNTEVLQDLLDQTPGEIRTKPGRGEPAISISCSDKLAKWNVLGLQGALIFSLLDKPIYYNSVTLCDSRYCDIAATKRAIWGRFNNPNIAHPFIVNQPVVQKSSRNFKFKYEKNIDRKKPAPGSIVVWSKYAVHQVSVNGKLQGATKKGAGCLKISKRELFRLYIQILKKYNDKLKIFENDSDFASLKYYDAKNMSSRYQQAWNQLKIKYFNVWTSKEPLFFSV